MDNLHPLPLKSKMGKWRGLPFACFILDLGRGEGGGGGVLFNFILFKTVAPVNVIINI